MSLSQWTGTANLVADAELNTTPNGKQVLKMRLAVNTGYGDKKKTMWLQAALWGDRGAKLVEYLTKGKQIALTGELSTREYTDKNNTPRLSIELNVQQIELMSRKSEAEAPAADDSPADDADSEAVPF
jgi:single-strand DNA-binding protein